MKKKLVIAVCILFAIVLLWNSRPRTLDTMLGLDTDDLTGIAASCVIGDVRDGRPVHDMYKLSQFPPEDAHFTALLTALQSTRYCASPVNLLPFPRNSVAGNHSAVSIHLTLAAGEQYAFLTFLTPRKLSLNVWNEDKLLVYFLMDDTACSTMQDYLAEHGTAD